MVPERIRQLLTLGENIAIEFKRCGNGIEHDTYESVCAFLNRFGGDLFLGVDDDGTVYGVPPQSAVDMAKNFVSCISNSNLLMPTVYLEPEILQYEGKTIIHVRVPQDGEIHSCKGVIYDRVGDADVKLRSSDQIADLGLRKRNIFTEQWLYPHVKLEDLHLERIPVLQRQAANMSPSGKHPWQDMTPTQILQSAGLYVENPDTGKMCLNLAAIMLLGRDDVIFDMNPTYMTDALLRKVNIDRYDDRLIVKTNLIDSYEQLTGFAAKHLLDKFYLEGDRRISLSGIIAREMIANTLIHREFSSHYMAKFVIMKDKMYVENACRAKRDGDITPDNLEPDPKNPRIASFFRNLGIIDTMGSGTRRLFKYVPYYSNALPILHEADVFRITVPLDDNYSFDVRIADSTAQVSAQVNDKYESDNSRKATSGEVGGEVEGNTAQVSAQVSAQVCRYCATPRSAKEIMSELGLRHWKNFQKRTLKPLLDIGVIEWTAPASPHSPKQKYRLTEKGRAFLEQCK